MLLRYISHFGCFSKIVVFSENKKMISFTIQQYTKPLVTLTRTVSQVTDVNKSVICTKFDELNSAVSQCQKIKKYELQELIDHLECPYSMNSNQTLSLIQWCDNISGCMPSDKIKVVKSLWFTLTACNFQLTVHHYNALLKIYLDYDYDFSPSDLLMKMNKDQICPNYFTYYMCINYYCMKGNINKAMLFIRNNINMLLYHSTEIYNSLLMGYSQLGDTESVDNIFNIMIQNNMELTTDTYAAIIYSYAKLNNIDKIEKIIHSCHSSNMYFNNIHILRVIYRLAKNNHVQRIDTMYKYLKETSQISNEETQVILDVLSIGQVNIAINMFLHIRESETYTLPGIIMEIILKHAVNINMIPNKIIEICDYFKYNENVHKRLLKASLYNSLLHDNHLSLALLKACKSHLKIKPHYFWPLIIRSGLECDFNGILNILDIMINEFNVSPCVYTISEFVLPMSFGNQVTDIRHLLVKYRINETVINNACVLFILNQYRLVKAITYVKNYPDQYLYEIHSHRLRKVSTLQNDVENFVNITCELLEATKYSENILNNNRDKLVPVPMDRQLHDVMIEYPTNKLWFKRVIECVITKNIRLKPETIKLISNYLHGYVTDDVIYRLENLSNKTTEMHRN